MKMPDHIAKELGLKPEKKKAKYNNEPVVINGTWFQSTHEGDRYSELCWMKKCRLIRRLKLQPKFILQEGFYYQGEWIKPIIYYADFSYYCKKRRKAIIEDAKGKRTEVYKIKKKMLLKKFPYINFEEV